MNCRCQGLSVVCSGGNGLHPGITSGFGLRSVRHTTWRVCVCVCVDLRMRKDGEKVVTEKELCVVVEDVDHRRTR